MNGLEEAYAPPQSDTDVEAAEADIDEDEEDFPAEWYAIPIWRLFLFSLVGGAGYQLHFMYRAWRAHRASFGYSAQQVWVARYKATRFRISPFWRAALVVYCYSWLIVVSREARRHRVASFGPAGLWFALHLAAVGFLPWPWNVVALSVVFLPAQLTVNRLHDRMTGDRVREPITAAELCWLGLGLLASLLALKTVRGA